MFFQYKKSKHLLRIDNFFANLKEVNEDDDMFFDFTYTISQSFAFKQKALAVEVSVYSQIITREKVLTNTVQRGSINSKKLIEKAQTQITSAKTTKKEQDEFLIARRTSDVTSYVNNSIVSKLDSGVDPKNIQEFNKRVIKLVDIDLLKNRNDDRPVLTYATPHAIYSNVDLATSASLDIDTKFHRLQMINKGIDPSYVTNMSHLSISTQDAVQGTLRKQKTNDLDYESQSQLLNSLIFSPDNFRKENTTNILQFGQKVHVLENQINDDLTIDIPVKIPKNRRKLPNGKSVDVIYVEFRLINSKTGEMFERVIKDVNLAKYYQFFMTPKSPPIVKATSTHIFSNVNLLVRQTAKNATSIAVYKKNVSKSVTTTDNYTLVGTYRLDSDNKTFTVPVDKPLNSTIIYRVISIGQTGILGSDFTNLVILPAKRQQKNSIAPTLMPIENGIQIEVSEIPRNVISIQPVVRNLTFYEKNYTNVTAPILIDDSIRLVDYFSTVDQNVIDGNTYEYAFRLYQRSGTVEVIGNTVISYNSIQPGKINIDLQNVAVTHDPDPNVTFDIKFDLIDTSVSVLNDMLNRDDISKFFDDDVKREREFLKDLISHNIQRVDLTTGERVDFGVLISSSFSDSELSVKNSITPLRIGHKYRYEIYTLLRSPETMFESFNKSKIDPVTKKPYKFRPSKFLHPIVLKRGVLVSANGIKSRFGQDQVMYGTIGMTKSLDVSFDKDSARIVDVSVTRFNKEHNLLSWRFEGNLDQVDHFIVMKEVNGVRTIIGKAHSKFEYGNCEMYHKLSGRDIGELRYLIIPVFNTYDSGPTVKSNVVLIED